MASRNVQKLASLSCKYQLRRGKTSSAPPEEGNISNEALSESHNIDNKQNKSGSKKRKSIQVKEETMEEAEEESQCKVPKDSPKKSIVCDIKKEEEERWFPTNWEKALDNIRQMRKEIEAPVDSMGCDMCHDKSTSPSVQRYQILVSLMLSSQTKDQVTFAAMGRLREFGLTPENIVKANCQDLEKIITPVGFYKRKSEYIKRASQILLNEYDGDIPNSVEELCKLPGVGPKMAHICMNSAWNVVSGIGVDTHVHRISHRIRWLPPKWMKKKKLTPEDTRQALESWLPQELWSEVNHLLVGFGQTICKPTGPSCKTCLNNSFCPSANVKW